MEADLLHMAVGVQSSCVIINMFIYNPVPPNSVAKLKGFLR